MNSVLSSSAKGSARGLERRKVVRQGTACCWRESANDEDIFMISDGSNPVGIYHGEFDPGSEQTLAACLKHAS